MLLDDLLDTARAAGFCKVLSRIFPFNTASRALCRACGFREVGRYEKHGQLDGQVIALFVMVVAAAEVVVGLAIIMAIFRARRSASVDDANLLKL